MSDTHIQFISAEELYRLAEMDKEERKARTVEGMIDQMDSAQQMIDRMFMQQSQPVMMVQWALSEPGEFFKLQAKLKLAKRSEHTVQRIQIGLPMTELDSLPSHMESTHHANES